MILTDLNTAIREKRERQRVLDFYSDKVQFHCGENCFHIGKVSHGNSYYFSNAKGFFCWKLDVGRDVDLPNVCNFNCGYCSLPHASIVPHFVKDNYVVPQDWEMKPVWKEQIKWSCEDAERDYFLYNFTGNEAETLFYLPCVEAYMNFFVNELEPIYNKRGWAKLSTNGVPLNKEKIQRLKDARIDELVVNISASNFSKDVYNNIEEAANHMIVTCCAPLWPLQREGYIEMLPILNDIGVKHLELYQLQILNNLHFEKTSKLLPSETKYVSMDNIRWPTSELEVLIVDDGLCEEIMTIVANNNYDYSVLDMNWYVTLPFSYDKEAFDIP